MRRTDLQQLIGLEEHPAVSIFMPTHIAHPENQQDPIRLKNLLDEARQRLDAEVGKRPSWPIIDQLERLAGDVDWRRNQLGLALFASESFATIVRLPFTVDERVTVDRTFETRELIVAQQRSPEYFVLSLAEQPSRLFRGEADQLEEVRTGGFPIAFEGPPGVVRRPDGPQMAGSNVREAHLQEFYRGVDDALADVLAVEAQPVILIGAQPALSVFDSVTRHADRIAGRIEGSHDEAAAAAIAALAWPEVQRWMETQRADAVAGLADWRGANRLATGIDDAWNAARAARGERLLVEESYRQPAKIDRANGSLQLLDASDDGAGPRHLDDAVDELAETVIAKGGDVLFVEDGALADYGRVALLLRY